MIPSCTSCFPNFDAIALSVWVHFKLVAKELGSAGEKKPMSKREEIKARIMERVAARVEKMLGQEEAIEKMTLTEIEEAALKVGWETEVAITAELAAAQRRREQEQPHCPRCGQEMRLKGYRNKEVITRTGEVKVRRAYYYCQTCRRGFYPPG